MMTCFLQIFHTSPLFFAALKPFVSIIARILFFNKRVSDFLRKPSHKIHNQFTSFPLFCPAANALALDSVVSLMALKASSVKNP